MESFKSLTVRSGEEEFSPTVNRSVIFNYREVSRLLALESELYKNIVDSERFFSHFFRVYFFGGGWKAAEDEVSGVTFVYRGKKMESISDFTIRS